jgi:hypothetical protein
MALQLLTSLTTSERTLSPYYRAIYLPNTYIPALTLPTNSPAKLIPSFFQNLIGIHSYHTSLTSGKKGGATKSK